MNILKTTTPGPTPFCPGLNISPPQCNESRNSATLRSPRCERHLTRGFEHLRSGGRKVGRISRLIIRMRYDLQTWSARPASCANFRVATLIAENLFDFPVSNRAFASTGHNRHHSTFECLLLGSRSWLPVGSRDGWISTSAK